MRKAELSWKSASLGSEPGGPFSQEPLPLPSPALLFKDPSSYESSEPSLPKFSLPHLASSLPSREAGPTGPHCGFGVRQLCWGLRSFAFFLLRVLRALLSNRAFFSYENVLYLYCPTQKPLSTCGYLELKMWLVCLRKGILTFS